MADDNAAVMALIKRQADQVRDQMKRQADQFRDQMNRNHDAFTKQQNDQFQRSQQADREHQDAMHRAAVAWTLYAGDEQLVRNPQTGQVSRVTNTAGTNVHQDQITGGMIASGDPNFDPSYYIRGQWTQLENVNPLAH
jgi:hypothetical protein